MPWTAPVVGYIDRLGRLRCTECAGESERAFPIYADNAAHNTESCERCTKPLTATEADRRRTVKESL